MVIIDRQHAESATMQPSALKRLQALLRVKSDEDRLEDILEEEEEDEEEQNEQCSEDERARDCGDRYDESDEYYGDLADSSFYEQEFEREEQRQQQEKHEELLQSLGFHSEKALYERSVALAEAQKKAAAVGKKMNVNKRVTFEPQKTTMTSKETILTPTSSDDDAVVEVLSALSDESPTNGKIEKIIKEPSTEGEDASEICVPCHEITIWLRSKDAKDWACPQRG